MDAESLKRGASEPGSRTESYGHIRSQSPRFQDCDSTPQNSIQEHIAAALPGTDTSALISFTSKPIELIAFSMFRPQGFRHAPWSIDSPSRAIESERPYVVSMFHNAMGHYCPCLRALLPAASSGGRSRSRQLARRRGSRRAPS